MRLVDFNPFGTRTDSLLYSWDELTSSGSDESSIELRLVDAETGVQQNEMGMYGCPLESLAATGLDSEALASLVQKVYHFVSLSFLNYT